jgi:hypothetical protein
MLAAQQTVSNFSDYVTPFLLSFGNVTFRWIRRSCNSSVPASQNERFVCIATMNVMMSGEMMCAYSENLKAKIEDILICIL